MAPQAKTEESFPTQEGWDQVAAQRDRADAAEAKVQELTKELQVLKAELASTLAQNKTLRVAKKSATSAVAHAGKAKETKAPSPEDGPSPTANGRCAENAAAATAPSKCGDGNSAAKLALGADQPVVEAEAKTVPKKRAKAKAVSSKAAPTAIETSQKVDPAAPPVDAQMTAQPAQVEAPSNELEEMKAQLAALMAENKALREATGRSQAKPATAVAQSSESIQDQVAGEIKPQDASEDGAGSTANVASAPAESVVSKSTKANANSITESGTSTAPKAAQKKKAKAKAVPAETGHATAQERSGEGARAAEPVANPRETGKADGEPTMAELAQARLAAKVAEMEAARKEQERARLARIQAEEEEARLEKEREAEEERKMREEEERRAAAAREAEEQRVALKAQRQQQKAENAKRLQEEKEKYSPEDFEALQMMRAAMGQPEEEESPEGSDVDEEALLEREMRRAREEEQKLSARSPANLFESMMQMEGVPMMPSSMQESLKKSGKERQRAALKEKLQTKRELASLVSGSGHRGRR